MDSRMDAKFQEMEEAYQRGKANATKPPLIREVPIALRGHKNFDKYFKPRAVSLGPIHYGKNGGTEEAEKCKLRLAEHFILEALKKISNTNPEHKELKAYKNWLYKKVEEQIGVLRECYHEEMTKSYNDEDLAWMLFVDGCSLLTFIHAMAVGVNLLVDLKIKNDLAAFGRQDAFLLENQLPFQLLRLLMCSTNQEETFTEYISKFINMEAPHDHHKTEQVIKISPECPHLLHLFRERIVAAVSDTHMVMSNNNNASRININEDGCESKEQHKYARTCRNIKELKAAGIELKPTTASSSAPIDFTNSFFKATLFLPPFEVDDWTAPKFLNLVAYEMCPDFFNDFEITSYVYFLDSRIDQAEDVKELRNAGILKNFLGSDEEVATLFNEISTDLVPNPSRYCDVEMKIQKRYNNPWKTLCAHFYYNHFTTPWTWGAFVGAVLGILLSAIQTWKAISQRENPRFELVININ